MILADEGTDQRNFHVKTEFPDSFLGFVWPLEGCEGSIEDPVVLSGVADPRELTQRAFQKQEIGTFEETIKIINKTMGPDHLQAHLNLASAYEHMKRRNGTQNEYSS